MNEETNNLPSSPEHGAAQQSSPPVNSELRVDQNPEQQSHYSSNKPNLGAIYPDPDEIKTNSGLPVNQLHQSQPSAQSFKPKSKKPLLKAAIALVLVGGILAALMFTNIISFSEFESVNYTDSKGTHYKFDFYTKHGSKKLQSGTSQLVSRVEKDGKFPLAISISPAEERGYATVKDCSGYTKVFDIDNKNLNQKISICDPFAGKQISGQNAGDGVYVAGFIVNNQPRMITIAQDLSGIDLSSPSGAQSSLSKFGMSSYRADIERIVSSIKLE